MVKKGLMNILIIVIFIILIIIVLMILLNIKTPEFTFT